MEALVRKLVEETMAQQAMCKELVGVLTAGHVGRPAGVAIPCPGSQQVCLAAARAAAAARDFSTIRGIVS